MKYIELDNGVQISTIGVGCMRIKEMDVSQVAEWMNAAIEKGINFFDHADIYGKGKSEEIFGKALSQQPSLRDKLFIQSKCAIHDGMYDFSKEYILKSVDGILQRLQIDYLDSLLLHRPDILMEIQEVKEAFEQLEHSGKVLRFGVSNMNRYQMEYLQSNLKQKIFANQLQLSVAHCPIIDAGIHVNTQENAGIMREAGTLEYCKMNDMILQTWSPLQKAMGKGTFINDPSLRKLNDLLEQLASQYRVDKDTIAYAWNLRLPAKIQVITGTTKKERLIHAVQATEINLTKKQWYDLYKAAGHTLP